MKHLSQKLITFLLLVICLFQIGAPLVQAHYNELPDSYRFNYRGQAVPTKDTYRLVDRIDSATLGVKIGTISNVFVGTERIFIVDSTNSQIIVCDHEFNVIEVMKNPSASEVIFKGPEGVWETPDGDIYVANTGNNNVLVFNRDYELVKTIVKPENMVGTTAFTPSKIAVDGANRIYIVVQSSTEGIIELSSEGEFLRYFGTNNVKINFIEYFWRMLSTKKQKSTLGIITAPPFNNITISNGFYYTTSSYPDAVENVKKFNSTGTDVILRQGYFPIVGNVQVGANQTSSLLTSITVNEYGIMAVLDSRNGHVYIYDNKGYLLNVFGGIGEGKSYLKNPGDVRWFNDNLIVSDKSTGSLLIYKPTEFGKAIMDAQTEYMKGNYEESYKNWLKVLKYDSNYERAYVGLGQYYYYEVKDYKKAMENYKIGNDRVGYGIALTSYRDEVLKENFGWFITPIILLIGLVFYTEFRYIKKSGD